MNLQEREVLSRLLTQLAEVKLASKDGEAEAMIREVATKQPDAVYLLAQRSLLLEQALNNAKAQIDDLQKQVQTASTSSQGGGFLGNNPWAQPSAYGNNGGGVPGSGGYQVPGRSALPPQQGGPFGGGSSFLGNIATTAAGVVAGSFLFHGIENMMGGNHSSGWGQQPSDNEVADNTVINNYYGDDAVQSANADRTDNSNDFLASDDADFSDGGDDSSWT